MSCCYKCPERTMTCHGTCGKYADEMAENEKKRKQRREEFEAKQALASPAFMRTMRDVLNRKK